ncbi:MAG: hypothetical protein ACC618_02335 [Patescibacteria group bacterium]
MEPIAFIRQTFNLKLGNWNLTPEYWTAATIVFLLFALVFSLARLRKMYVHWSLKGFVPQVLIGFVLALVLEGFLILGGRTLLTSILGWDNAPKPISTALDIGRAKLVNVLGASDEAATSKSVVLDFQSLSSTERDVAKIQICEP